MSLSCFPRPVSDTVRWMWPVTIGVIVVEVDHSCFSLVSSNSSLGALFAAALLLGFAAYAFYYVYVLHGEPLECGCFGGSSAASWV